MSDHGPAKKTSSSGGKESKLQSLIEGVVDEIKLHDGLAKPFVEGFSEFFADGKGGGGHGKH